MKDIQQDSGIKLTGYTKFSGCGAKLGPGLLDRALCNLSQRDFPELLVDYRSADDAGIWKIDDETALVQTVDFFPPIADDPFTFGRIAAANALSDVYAMGGRPITAMSIVAFPADRMDISVLRDIMAGALDALDEAGTALVGGHSIRDEELKFGLSVTGLVHPRRTLRNNSPRPGDALILTKKLGTGCISRALKAGKASSEAVEAANRSMSALNRRAAEILSRYPVSACTDVTGFGLAGHGCEMISGSGCGMRIFSSRLETLPGALEYIRDGLVPGGTVSNREFREGWIAGSPGEDLLNLVFDPQTSGGLMAALPEIHAEKAVEELKMAGIQAFRFGEISGGPERIEIVSG
jgi:selenide,water dikinase